MTQKKDGENTRIIKAGRQKKWVGDIVNPPVHHASTVIFETVKDMRNAIKNRHKNTPYYGRRGTPTNFALSDAMCEIEGGDGCYLYPSGLAAINGVMMAFLKPGDHILMVDGAYEPTRGLCNTILKKIGVEVSFYDPLIGAGISALMQDNTRMVFTESPCSITMEVQDIPAIAKAAHAHGALVVMDNTWASPLFFKPFDHGVDLSIQAATKYIVGHSDAMLGTVTARKEYCDQLFNTSYQMGYCVAPDDAYLALRGLRTLSVRLKQHEKNALIVANWLKDRPEVAEVRHPALETNPGHTFWKRDFTGSSGLFSIILKEGTEKAITEMLDHMSHFKMGFSWGGFESLILPVPYLANNRTAVQWKNKGPVLRLHIGLEDTDDLIKDLEQGFERFNYAL